MLPIPLLLLLYHAAPSLSHGIMTRIVVASTATYPAYNPDYQYLPTPVPRAVGWITPANEETGPVDANHFDNPDIICHLNATPARNYAEVKAGEVINFQWTTWPVSHHGPMIDYLARCDGSCSKVDKTKLEWFKIDGVGMIDNKPEPALFGSDLMIKGGMSWNVRIPTAIEDGEYVLRHETIALHVAEELGGAQAYP